MNWLLRVLAQLGQLDYSDGSGNHYRLNACKTWCTKYCCNIEPINVSLRTLCLWSQTRRCQGKLWFTILNIMIIREKHGTHIFNPWPLQVHYQLVSVICAFCAFLKIKHLLFTNMNDRSCQLWQVPVTLLAVVHTFTTWPYLRPYSGRGPN